MLSFMTPGGGRTCLMAGVAKKYADGVPHLVIFVHASQHGRMSEADSDPISSDSGTLQESFTFFAGARR